MCVPGVCSTVYHVCIVQAFLNATGEHIIMNSASYEHFQSIKALLLIASTCTPILLFRFYTLIKIVLCGRPLLLIQPTLLLKFQTFAILLTPFLALLDYVSRAHGIAICPSSVVRPSSVRPCRNYL